MSRSALTRQRALARAALWWERIWPALWPPLSVVGSYSTLALLDVPGWLPPVGRVLAFGCFATLTVVLLWRGLARIRPPSLHEVDRRLERASGLRHRPLTALQDRPSQPTPEAEALWGEHLRRLSALTARLRVGPPRPGLPALDTRAMRGGLIVALGAALVVAGPEAGQRLLRGVMPTWPVRSPAPPALVQAWITPPAYTSLPPRVLPPTTPTAAVPIGTRLTVSVTGVSGAPTLQLDDQATSFEPLDSASFQVSRELTTAGRLSVTLHGDALAAWALTVIPDLPPIAAFTEPPGPGAANGRPTLQTRLPWRAEDDYGLAGVQAELRLQDRPDAAPLVIPLPLAGSPKTARSVSTPDLTPHPWAGLGVIGTIVARDALGQIGTSAPMMLTLPERAFRNPVARAVIAIRRQLSLTPGDLAREQARTALDGIADHPEAFDQSNAIVLNLRAISALLARNRAASTVDDAQTRMWALALSLEEGALDRTSKALEAARQAVREALNKQNAQKPEEDKPDADKPADPAEAQKQGSEKQADLDKRTQELREAIQRQLEALAEQAKREGAAMPFDPGAPQLNARELDRKAQELQKSAKEGRMDDAKQQLAELEKLLEELQNARPESGEAREQKNAERRERGKQQQSAVQDMVKREGGMLDRTQSRGATPTPDGAAAPTPDSKPQDGRAQDGKGQLALRRALGELMQRFGDLTGDVPPSLGDADLAMRDAGEALSRGQDSAAGAAVQRAIEALQKGGRDMGQQVARQFGTGEQGEGEGDDGQGDEPGSQAGGDTPGSKEGAGPGQTGRGQGDQGPGGRRRTAHRDPLGRPSPTGVGGTESGDVHVPDEMEQARGRALQDELRRRGAERSRPQPELNYIDRLLQPY